MNARSKARAGKKIKDQLISGIGITKVLFNTLLWAKKNISKIIFLIAIGFILNSVQLFLKELDYNDIFFSHYVLLLLSTITISQVSLSMEHNFDPIPLTSKRLAQVDENETFHKLDIRVGTVVSAKDGLVDFGQTNQYVLKKNTKTCMIISRY